MKKLLFVLFLALLAAPSFAVGGTRVAFRTGTYSMGDAATVNLFTVSLPTEDTGCSVQLYYGYTVTDAANTAAHSGRVTYAITNDDTTVTGTAADASEAVNGTGCNAACDAWSGSVATTTFTGTANFNNTLTATGTLSIVVFATDCTALTML